MRKKVIIIGAGLAGLAAGCYGQMNGYETEIFELHDLPGGLCTAWERNGYIFDGCIHYLYGSANCQPFNNLWQELGALDNTDIINHDEFMRVIAKDGRVLIAYCDPDRFEKHFLEQAPEDKKLIHNLANGIRRFQDFDMALLFSTPREQMGIIDWAKLGLRMLPYLGTTAQFGLFDAQQMASRFRNPFLRNAFPHLFAWPEIPMIAALSLLAYMNQGNAGFPAGGSLEFARRIEKHYLDLGGVIHYKNQVQEILVKNHKAVGVRLYDDEEHSSDYVISTADGFGTIYQMLDGKYTNAKLDKLYRNGNLPILSQLLVSFGVKRDLSAEPHWATYLLDETIGIAGEEHSQIGVKNYCFDPRLAPPGHSVIEVMLRSDYEYWKRIYGRKLYDTEQIQVEQQVINFLEMIYPGIRDEVETIDVATPLSYERYTGNWQGATCGWLLTKKTMLLMLRGLRKNLPGLENFYMAGQWVEPGGSLTSAAYSGRNAIRSICRRDGHPFCVTTINS